MIDSNLKPWLIEINASPSLSDTTAEDKTLKKALINDVFNIVMPGDWLKTRANVGTDTCKETKVGSFEVLIDEANNKYKSQLGVKRPASANGASRLAQSTVNKFAKKPIPFFR